MTKKTTSQLINYSIALVWLINGLVCKLLNFVPRHQQIVGRILGDEHARVLTSLIGISEIFIAIWILSGKWPEVAAVTQIVIIAAMNCLEFFLVPGLLLWGKANAIFALLLISLIYYNGFYFNRN